MSHTKNQCLIASYKGDFVWLRHCLRSLKRFSKNFLPPVVAVSHEDLEGARAVVQQAGSDAEVFCFSLPRHLDHSSGFGMMRAMCAMMHGDVLCPQADNIFLVGSDCIATYEFDANHYLQHGQPIVLMSTYEKLAETDKNVVCWRDGTARVLGWTPPFEYMRRLPSVFDKSTFAAARDVIERLHGETFMSYWYGSYAAGQRGHSEANILGAVAHKFQSPLYRFENMDNGQSEHFNPLLQMWSHGGMEKPIDIHYTIPSGDVFGRRPIDVIHEVLGPE